MTEKLICLTSNHKLLIQEYLESRIRRWLAIVGIANAGVVAAALFYVFLMLPGKAVREACNMMESQLKSHVEILENKTFEGIESSGQIKARMDSISRDVEVFRKRNTDLQSLLRDLETKVQAIKKTPDYGVVEAISELNKGKNAKEILNRLSKIDSKIGTLEGELGKAGKGFDEVIIKDNGVFHVLLSTISPNKATQFGVFRTDTSSTRIEFLRKAVSGSVNVSYFLPIKTSALKYIGSYVINTKNIDEDGFSCIYSYKGGSQHYTDIPLMYTVTYSIKED